MKDSHGPAPDEPSAPRRRSVNYRELMKQVERVVGGMEEAADQETAVRSAAETIIARFRDQLGIFGGRLYRRRGGHYVLQTTFGEAREIAQGLRVPVTYEPIQLVLEGRTVYMDARDPRANRRLERRLGVEKFAAIEVGDGEYILAFDVAPGHHGDDVLYSLGIVRHSINQRLREGRWAGIFRQASSIQTSILPRRAPHYGPFDIAGRTEPLEIVGGDFYDFIQLTDKILGLAIADVSGHGLPAALLVRDIHMGLRMGLTRDLKIVRTVERLNSIIHASALTSRFVSMFYGELELNGIFIYVNAGHPPPFHLAADGTVRRLEEGGAVLGPLADVAYERGFVRLAPGDLLVLYTDGIVETRLPDKGANGEEYGVDRLLGVARAHRDRPAEKIVDAIFTSVRNFCQGCPAQDDRTVVVVRYPG